MAFELPSLPSFNVQTPQMPSALEQYGRMLQLKALAGQQQLLPLQIEGAQQDVQAKTLENQQRQAELQSRQAMIKAWSDPKFIDKFTGTDAADKSGVGVDPNAATSAMINAGVMPEHAMAMTAQLVDRAAKMATTLKDQGQAAEALAGVRSKTFDALGDKFGSIIDANKTDPAKAQTMLTAFQQDLVTNPKAYQGLTQQEVAELKGPTTLDHLPAIAGLMGFEGRIADHQKAQFEAQKAAQGVIPAGGGLSPDTQQQVDKDVAVATNPKVQAGKAAVAAAEGEARANVEHQIAVGGQAALANVPTHLIPAATEAATKAGTDFAQAKSVSDRLQAMMDAAAKGNVVSYQLIPQEGALQVTTSQGVHRINMAEIQNYGGGSLWQRLEGHFGKALTGESIPKSVLDDMAAMQKIQSQGAETKYKNTLKTINRYYGASFQPIEMEDMTAKKPAATGGAFSWDNMPRYQQ